MIDIETAIKAFLITKNYDLLESSELLPIYTYEFPQDAERVALMIRHAGGLAPDPELELEYPMFQVWVRADDEPTATALMKRIDILLHRLGPKALTTEVKGLSIVRNTGWQRLDDLEIDAVQFFSVFNSTVCQVA